MTEYAKIGKDGRVETVIVIEPEMLATGRWGDPKNWVPAERVGRGYKYDAQKRKFTEPEKRPVEGPFTKGPRP